MSKHLKIGIGVLIAMSLVLSSTKMAEAPNIMSKNITEVQRPDALDNWLTKLAFCESSNNPDAINWDDVGSPSFGYLQWKTDSFWAYNNLYEVLPDLEKSEVENIITGDKEIQIKLARIVILEEHSGRGWRNWWNCSRRAGLKELERIRNYYKKYGVVPQE